MASSDLLNQKKERVLTYHLLSHGLRVASCREFFSEILIFAKKEMLAHPNPTAEKIQKYWANSLVKLNSKEETPPSVDIENCELDLELYVGYHILERELEDHLTSMAEIQLKIATLQSNRNCTKSIMMDLVGEKKYHETFWYFLEHPKGGGLFRHEYRMKKGFVSPNGFTTGGCEEMMEKARVEIERIKNKYSYI
ncbi:MAG: hypothetical protein ACKOB3_02610 [Holophagaceae bacterium]